MHMVIEVGIEVHMSLSFFSNLYNFNQVYVYFICLMDIRLKDKVCILCYFFFSQSLLIFACFVFAFVVLQTKETGQEGGSIKVFCRFGPPLDVKDPDKRCAIEFESSFDNQVLLTSSDSSIKKFNFDHVFRPEDDQDAVFAKTIPVAISVLDGCNVCIFSYGPNASGKTFTMEGSPDNRGLYYRTVEELFRISEEKSMSYEIFVSMLEVYNETIRDLSVDNSNQPPAERLALKIKPAPLVSQEIPKLATVYGKEKVLHLLESGAKARSIKSTTLNEQSSRSHF